MEKWTAAEESKKVRGVFYLPSDHLLILVIMHPLAAVELFFPDTFSINSSSPAD